MVEFAPDGEEQLVNGRYRLIETIGRGGMGAVWRGHDEMLDREVAIKKVLFDPGLSDEERAELTALAFQEARATARLNHPGIVTIHDVIDDDAPVIVMELIDGRSLADILKEEVRLPYRRVAEIGAAVLDALREAHAAGIVHRDLKPANVLITDRRVVITDFGVAQRVGERADDAEDVLGTPAFMAPEQVENAAASPAADLWSLGATLFNAVTGRPPFQGPDYATVLLTLLTQEAPPPVNAGPLAPLITALLRKDPDRRPTAEEAAERLDAILQQDEDDATAATPAIAPPDTGDSTAAPPATSPPAGGTTTSGGAAADQNGGSASVPAARPSAPKPKVGSGAVPGRPHYTRSSVSPRPHRVPAPAPAYPRLGRAAGGTIIVVICIAVLYACVHGTGNVSPTGVAPSPSDPFGGLPGIPSDAPSSPPDASPSPADDGFQVTALSSDGRRVAFGGDSGVIKVYDTASHKLQHSFDASPDSIQVTDALALAPDGRTLAVAADGPPTIWDTAGHKKRRLSGFEGTVGALRFGSDGRTVTALGTGGTIGHWNLRTGKYASATIPLHGDALCIGMSLSADGRYAACGHYSGSDSDDDNGGILVWDTEKDRQVAALPDAGPEPIAISPDGRTLVHTDDGGSALHLWNLAANRDAGVLGATPYADALAFSPDGKKLAIPADAPETQQPIIEIWDLATDRSTATLQDVEDQPHAIVFSADGRMLAAADDQGGKVWNVRSHKRIASWSP
ncbi:serine/threonine-protein kinase [Actinoallomurus sp. NBC_01490]|uniref:WD40 repeat domain-containing serine/threonine protein kinase n=1 Tax=Actinoallomurus sp. NBC_01490 TaxID=2903557 RepID=UPI002E31E548|nr:serine/threonine-protein kinase [Actinoallomurus sp. NBC_01490]